MVRALGGLAGVESALSALDDSSANDPFPYHSTLKVIRELLQMKVPVRDALVAVGEHFRQRLPEAMRGEPLDAI
jgi:hypothetical protein